MGTVASPKDGYFDYYTGTQRSVSCSRKATIQIQLRMFPHIQRVKLKS